VKHVVHPKNHKLIIVAVATLASFFGLQAISKSLESYQLGHFLWISLVGYAFLVFWQSVVFDLHLRPTKTLRAWKKTVIHGIRSRFAYLSADNHGVHYYNFLVLPGIIYWSAVVLLFLNPFETGIKQVVILASSAALTIAYWYMKTVFYEHKNTHRNVRQIIFLTKLFASYASFTAVFGLVRYFGAGAISFAMAVFALTYVLIHQAFYQHHYIRHNTVKLILIGGLVTAEFAAMIFSIWNVNYFSGALAISAVYNAIWGLMQHKFIENNLRRELIYEYFAVLFLILVLVFSTTNFSERIY